MLGDVTVPLKITIFSVPLWHFHITLISFETVFKGYQQMTKVATSKESYLMLKCQKSDNF